MSQGELFGAAPNFKEALPLARSGWWTVAFVDDGRYRAVSDDKRARFNSREAAIAAIGQHHPMSSWGALFAIPVEDVGALAPQIPKESTSGG